MSGPFVFLIPIALIAVLIVLGLGVFGMARGGDFNSRHSNRLMRWRVILQFAAIILLILGVLLSRP